MLRASRLVIGCGLLGLLFFWVTDPTWGMGRALMDIVGTSQGMAVMDARRQAMPGTLVGLFGSAGVLMVGLLLLFRRQQP